MSANAARNSATTRTIRAVMIVCFLFSTIAASPFSQKIRELRSLDNNVDALASRQNHERDQDVECPSGMACAWEVYTPVYKAREYYLTNACHCPQGSRCERYEEDLAINAFVYKCKH